MCNNRLSAEDVAKETFKLVMHAFTHKNNSFKKENHEKIKKFKAHRKKLYILFCINSKKNCTLKDLENMLMENRSTASAAVTKLYMDGYIDKSHPEKGDDGRKVYFKVTKKGKEILGMLTETFEGDVKDFYNSLSDENKNNFINGVMCLNKIFE